MSKRNTKRAIKILRDARALIAKNWTMGKLEKAIGNGEYAFCAVGALNKAYAGDARTTIDEYANMRWFSHSDAYNLAFESLTKHTIVNDSPYWGIVYFNDAPTTTQDDVLDVFDNAIKDLEAKL